MMKDRFEFMDIDGEENSVTFEIVQTEADYRIYGIGSKQFNKKGQVVDSALAAERFITRAEAEAIIDMLCDCCVMPCTLCDVV